MKTKRINFIIACLMASFFIVSCSKDEATLNPDDPNLNYDYGFFVLNEGGSSGGSVTFVSPDLQTVQHNVYQAENPNEALGLGLYLQSVFFHENKAYIISNGSNLITVVDRNTFELLGKVDSGLNIPRYGVVSNGKAYVTNQASFQAMDDDFVAVINLETLEVEEKILLEGPLEFILEKNAKLYVQNAAYNMGNQVSVIDPQTNQVEETIAVSQELNSIDIEGNYLYALGASVLKKVDLSTLEVSSVIAFLDDTKVPANLEIEDGKIFYTVGKQVFSMPLAPTELPTEPVLTYESNSQFGLMYGFAVENDRIFIADAGDFASAGNVFVYSEDGQEIKEIEVGVAPNGFYFNK